MAQLWKKFKDRIGPKPIEEQTALERHRTLVDAVQKALYKYQGAQPIPVSSVTVHVLAPDPGERDVYRAALEDADPPFPQAVATRLHQARIRTPEGFRVEHVLHDEPGDDAPSFERHGPVYVEMHTERQAPTPERATVEIGAGKAEEASYELESRKEPYHVGRLRYVHEYARTNEIAFLDPDEHPDMSPEERRCNAGVSRIHGRIVFDQARNCFCWENQRGSTRLKRAAFQFPQHVGGHLPFPLQNGDVLFLGDGHAMIRITIGGAR